MTHWWQWVLAGLAAWTLAAFGLAIGWVYVMRRLNGMQEDMIDGLNDHFHDPHWAQELHPGR